MGRLQTIWTLIISLSQGAFVHGRQISDGVLIANECVHSRHRDRELRLLCKLDLEKAFDSVDWGFLQYLMKRMGFGIKWRKWIHECVSSAYFPILINGSPKGFFPAQRGLRLGDPLFPFLFTIVGEALSRMVEAISNKGLIRGFKVAHDAPIISHLQYADDTLFLSG